jgi:hypothetical protein
MLRCQNDPSCKAGQHFSSYFNLQFCDLKQLPSSGYVTVEQFKNVLFKNEGDNRVSFYKQNAEQDKLAREKRNKMLVKGKLKLCHSAKIIKYFY